MLGDVPGSARNTLILRTGFDLRRGDASLPVPLPAQRLLAYLALQNRPQSRRGVASLLWSDLDDQQAAARLRSTLWRLPTPGGSRLVDVDVQLARDDSRISDLDLTLLCGEVLADWTEDWVLIERERVRQLRLHRLEQVSERARHRGNFDLALQAALAAVAVEPLRESAHRYVMLVHLAEQNPSEALRQYDAVRQLLRDELGWRRRPLLGL